MNQGSLADRTGRQYHKAERCFASRILDPTEGIWADKAAKIADRIYQCNATGSSGAGENEAITRLLLFARRA
jgi:hypothetical protein